MLKKPANYSNSPRYRVLRKQLIKPTSFCVFCRSTWALCLHHNTYANWPKERLEDFTVCCASCHTSLHKRARNVFVGPLEYVKSADERCIELARDMEALFANETINTTLDAPSGPLDLARDLGEAFNATNEKEIQNVA